MAWADATYRYKKKITIDYTKVGGDEVNFPVLVLVTDNNLKSASNGGHVQNSNGYDICFYNSTEATKLAHEIELYVSTTGQLIFWVNIPSLSSTTNTIFYIYYGKTGVSADPSSTSTWDVNFLGVYHLDEASGATCDDSTVNGNDGTYYGNLPTQVTGQIGYGQDFAGNDYIVLPSAIAICTAGTIELWAEADLTTAIQCIFVSYGDSSNNHVTFHLWSNAKVEFWGKYSGVYQWDINPIGYDTNYHYWGMAFQTNDAILIQDSTTLGTDTSLTTASFTQNNAYVGENNAGTSDYDGELDEFRVSSTRRSNNWMNTSYNTENSPATFMSFGNETERTRTIPRLNEGFHLRPRIKE